MFVWANGEDPIWSLEIVFGCQIKSLEFWIFRNWNRIKTKSIINFVIYYSMLANWVINDDDNRCLDFVLILLYNLVINKFLSAPNYIHNDLLGALKTFIYLATLKSLIEEHARLDFSDFLSTLLVIFHVINKKFLPARLLISLVNKQARWHFLPSLLVYSSLLFY